MKTILRAASVLVIIAGLAGGNVATGQTGSLASRREIARLAETVMRKDLVRELGWTIPRLMTEGEVPGLQIALVRGGKVDWIKSFGFKNAETGGAVTDETIFEAASPTQARVRLRGDEAG